MNKEKLLKELQRDSFNGQITIPEFIEKVKKYAELYAQEIQNDLKVTNSLYEERQRLLDAIPECPTHGKCVPYVLEWIERMKTLEFVGEKVKFLKERGGKIKNKCFN